MYALVGSNSAPAADGLRLVDVNPATAEFHEVASAPAAVDPIYFAPSPVHPGIWYVAQRSSAPDGAVPGAVAVYRVDPSAPALTLLQEIPCAPTVPCHVSASPDGSLVAFAEYRNAHAGVFRVRADGLLDAAPSVVHHTGHGPNPVRQEAAHCHYAAILPGNRLMYVCDLGIDKIVAYALDPVTGSMTAAPDFDVTVPAGLGPRHLAFHPSLPYAYLVCELGSSVIPYSVGPDGRLTDLSAPLSMLPPDFSGETKAAAVKISPDGTLLVASNRGHDSLASFRIDPATGTLAPLAIAPLQGRFPRDFEFFPGGKFLLAAHKLSDEYATYAVDSETGALALVQRSAKIQRPLCFRFLSE